MSKGIRVHEQDTRIQEPPDDETLRDILSGCAQQYAGMGLTIIPLKYRDKRPLDNAWQKTPPGCTAERLKIWEESEHNIGILTGVENKVIALDFDLKTSESVFSDFALVEQQLGTLPQSPRALSGRADGGYKMLFRVPSEVPSIPYSRSFLGIPGVELIGDGGHQVVLPPSVFPAGEGYLKKELLYTWETTPTCIEDFPFLPKVWIDAHLQYEAKAREGKIRPPATEVQHIPPEQRQTLEYMVKVFHRKCETEWHSRGDTLFHFGIACHSTGYTEEECLETALNKLFPLIQHVNSEKNRQFGEKDIQYNIHRAYEKTPGEPWLKNEWLPPAVTLLPDEATPEEILDDILKRYSEKDIEKVRKYVKRLDDPSLRYAYQMIDEDIPILYPGVNCWYAKAGMGKSMFAIQCCTMLAIRGKKILYIAAEDASETRSRFWGYMSYYQLPPEGRNEVMKNILILSDEFSMHENSSINRMKDACNLEAFKPNLVVADTYMRTVAGVEDHHKNDAIREYISRADDLICKPWNCAFLYIDHESEKGTSGYSIGGTHHRHGTIAYGHMVSEIDKKKLLSRVQLIFSDQGKWKGPFVNESASPTFYYVAKQYEYDDWITTPEGRKDVKKYIAILTPCEEFRTKDETEHVKVDTTDTDWANMLLHLEEYEGRDNHKDNGPPITDFTQRFHISKTNRKKYLMEMDEIGLVRYESKRGRGATIIQLTPLGKAILTESRTKNLDPSVVLRGYIDDSVRGKGPSIPEGPNVSEEREEQIAEIKQMFEEQDVEKKEKTAEVPIQPCSNREESKQ